MSKVKFSDVVIRANTKEDRHNTDLEFYVGGEHIDTDEVIIEKRGIIAGSTIGPMFYFGFKAGQVLFVSRNPHLRKAGMVTFDGICSEKTFVLETKDESVLLQSYLPFILQSDHFWSYAEAHKSGSVNFFINWSTLANYEFDLPCIQKQQELADVLWAMTETRAAYKKLITSTDELVKSQFIEFFGDPVTNSKKLEIKPFKHFMKNIRYGVSQPPSFTDDGIYKFIRATNIKSGRIVEKDMLRISEDEASKISKCRLDGNEIIIVRSGVNTGDSCVVTEEYRDQYAGYDIIISLNEDIANPIFFNELINTHYMQDVIKPLTVRSAQPHINAEQVQNLPMITVPLSEQERFSSFVKNCDKSKAEIEASLSRLTSAYHSILSENFA